MCIRDRYFPYWPTSQLLLHLLTGDNFFFLVFITLRESLRDIVFQKLLEILSYKRFLTTTTTDFSYKHFRNCKTRKGRERKYKQNYNRLWSFSPYIYFNFKNVHKKECIYARHSKFLTFHISCPIAHPNKMIKTKTRRTILQINSSTLTFEEFGAHFWMSVDSIWNTLACYLSYKLILKN